MAVKKATKKTTKKSENFILITFDKTGDMHLQGCNVTNMQQIQAMLLLMEGMRETLSDTSLHTAIDAIMAYKDTLEFGYGLPIALGKNLCQEKKLQKKTTKKVAKKK